MDRRHTAEQIYRAWDDALARKDIDPALSLYAPDATIESPLIPHLMGCDQGICRGHAELRRFIEAVFARKPRLRGHHRNRLFTDGKTLMWEYPRSSPAGDQMDFVEVMELGEGLIQRHRVYWGWLGVGMLERDQYWS